MCVCVCVCVRAREKMLRARGRQLRCILAISGANSRSVRTAGQHAQLDPPQRSIMYDDAWPAYTYVRSRPAIIP